MNRVMSPPRITVLLAALAISAGLQVIPAWAASYTAADVKTTFPKVQPRVIQNIPEQTVTYNEFVQSEPVGRQLLSAQRWRHPSVAANGSGVMARMYEYYDGVLFDSSYMYINGSANFGTSWAGCCFLDLRGGSYPSIDYYGGGTQMYGTFVPPSSFQQGAAFMLASIPDPNNPGTWSVSFFSLAGLGWVNMKAVDIASDNSQQSWNWGFQSAILSRTFDPAVNNISVVFGRHNNLPFGSFFVSPQNCQTTAAAIDRSNGKTYAAYDYIDSTDLQYKLFFRQDVLNNWSLPTVTAIKEMTDNDLNLRYPDISVDSGYIVVVAAVYDAGSPNNHDIIAFRSIDGSGAINSLSIVTTIAGTTDSENFPTLTDIKGDTVGCVFVRNNALFATWSFDRGITWSPPGQVSAPGDSIVDEYRTTHFNVGIQGKAFAQKHVVGNPNIQIELTQYDVGLPDSDIDGVPDIIDNCPFGPNPGQEDVDGDGIGDVCDFCPNDAQNDSDGDGICGDVDNCPTVFNAAQTDGDSDGVGDDCDNCPSMANTNQMNADNDAFGDVCDSCTDTDGDGRGNPGFPANTCPSDNCPYIANPGQEDTDSDGIGDLCDVCGDADGNGVISIADVVFLINYIFGGGLPPVPLLIGDANCSGNVSVADAVYVLNYIFDSGPPPCPSC